MMSVDYQQEYEHILHMTDKPFCWVCGRKRPPRGWVGPWRLERAHLWAGSGVVSKRVRDSRAINLACTCCHKLHTHKGGTTMRINGVEYLTISDAQMLWIKRDRDPERWAPSYLQTLWIGRMPAPVMPHRQSQDSWNRHQSLSDWLANPTDEALAERYVQMRAARVRSGWSPATRRQRDVYPVPELELSPQHTDALNHITGLDGWGCE